MLRATAVAYAVAALALAHLLVVLRLLWLDALAPPFGALLLDDELARSARTLVLMHHRRLPELNATLRGVAALPRAAELRVIVAQTVGASERAAGAASGALVRALAGELPFGALEHHLVVREAGGGAADGSTTTDAERFGTKKNSFRNMLNGLEAAFGGATKRGERLAGALVAEDDVALSPDALEYFDFAASLLAGARALPPPARPVLATSFCILRNTHADYPGPLPLASALLPRRAAHYRHGPLRDLTFKTFAWLITREAFDAMRREVPSMLAMPGDARELHETLAGCPYCANFCYDHYLEWRWRESTVVCPEVPRARQLLIGAGGGMTERPGVTGAAGREGLDARRRAGTELNDAFVRRWQFVDGAQRRRARKTLDALALWLLPALAARGLFHALRGCRRRQTARALLARCDATMPAPGAPLKSV